MLPTVRRSWAPTGQTPILRHVLRSWSKVSAISALSMSPIRQRWSFYARFYSRDLVRAPQVLAFLKLLRRQLHRPLILLWDRGQSHKALDVRQYLERHRATIRAEFLPPYAPELNPVEFGWAYLKHQRIPNHGYPRIGRLHRRLRYEAGRLRRRQDLLGSFMMGCDLWLHRKPRHSPRGRH